MNDIKTNASVTSSVSAAILGTTCCALPIVLVTLGMGGAVASLAASAPWLIELSKYKEITFLVTASILGYSWWQIRKVTECSIADARRLRWQRAAMWISTALFVGSLFAAYAMLPIALWLEN